MADDLVFRVCAIMAALMTVVLATVAIFGQ
jgi:hypothetical protein